MTPAVVLGGSDAALFASDVHLGEHDPATADAFFDALTRQVTGISHLFLLGDLFEAWVGDDQDDAPSQRAARYLRAVVSQGTRVLMMRGNRDFLLDAPVGGALPFADRIGATLLTEPAVVNLFGTPTLLVHGDAQCTDDAEYQRLRLMLRDPAWQAAFLSKPLAERTAYARSLRERSEQDKAGKAEYLMDVNPQAICAVMRTCGVLTMVQGHTHRPACHRFEIDAAPAVRWVLPDWDASAGRGGFLRVDVRGWATVGRWHG